MQSKKTEKLLGNIVFAHRVLESQIKEVLLGHDRSAIATSIVRIFGLTLLPTFAKDVHPNVFGQIANQIKAFARAQAV
jgi:hypothetical protein